VSPKETRKSLFDLGQFVATPGTLEALQVAVQQAYEFLIRHASGNWGELNQEDKRLNEAAVIDGSCLLSAYQGTKRERIWIITEAADDRGHRD
jgi:hypothetical protein